jgi:two-component system, NtrC family, nitrogen regulation sensor histidine kinase NtrY
MNVSTRPRIRRGVQAPLDIISEPKFSAGGRLGDILLGKGVTLLLTGLALAVGMATFIILARGSPLGWKPGVVVGLVLANVSVLLMLGAVLAARLTRVLVERRRGSAGSRLHVRLVFLFSGIAVLPTILVGCFAVAFFHFGI